MYTDGKIYFGPYDTNLYRLNPGTLKTDGSLVVAGHLFLGDVLGSNTNGTQAAKKVAVYDATGTLAGYAQLFTG
jgi:outer membrane protein assembly factor BamB